MSSELSTTGTITPHSISMFVNTTTTTTNSGPVPIPETTPSNKLINTEAQTAINFILWGASGLALFVLFIRILIAVFKRLRHRSRNNLPLFGSNSVCRIHEEPPPNYSDLSVRTLPPSYSQGCRILHYHPSSGNTSQQTISNDSGVSMNAHDSTGSFENDFIAPPSNDVDDENSQRNFSDNYRNETNSATTPRQNGGARNRRVRFECDCALPILDGSSNQNAQASDVSENDRPNNLTVITVNNSISPGNQRNEHVSDTDQIGNHFNDTP